MADAPKKIGGVKPKAARPSKPRASSAAPHPESIGHAVRLIDDRIAVHARELRALVTEIRDESAAKKQTTLSIDSTPIGWFCAYNCVPTPTQLGLIHRYDCPHWDNEGKDEHPL